MVVAKIFRQGPILLRWYAGYCKIRTLGFKRSIIYPFHRKSLFFLRQE